MFWNDLIFSDQKGYKLSRHLLFWTARFLFVIGNKLINNYTMGNGGTPWESLTELSIVLGVKVGLEAAYCYAVIYWLLPKYLVREKYLTFVTWLLCLSALDILLFAKFLNLFLDTFAAVPLLNLTWWFAPQFIMSGGFPIGILLIAYKMLKTWYQKEEERLALTIGNTNAELQLLKAQVHPHFLFNTLNNIYSYTLDKSPLAGELVIKLSHILRYMTGECEQSFVPLCSEVKVLLDYIGLEKVRYGDRLDLQVEITGDAENKLIAPLLMIPFVENSFKHGASKMLQHPWIKLSIMVEEDRLFFNLSNSRPFPPQPTNGKNGLGLSNVRRRLQLLYPGTHAITVNAEGNVFTVQMASPLEKTQRTYEPLDTHPEDSSITNHTPTYAGI